MKEVPWLSALVAYGWHLAGEILNCTFMKEYLAILIHILLMFVL